VSLTRSLRADGRMIADQMLDRDAREYRSPASTSSSAEHVA